MKLLLALLSTALTATLHAAPDIDLTETVDLPESHSIGWVRANTGVKVQPGWDGKLDEVKWGTPSPAQVIERNWDWKLTDAQWQEAANQKPGAKLSPCNFSLWIPGDIPYAKGIVAISAHGSGAGLFKLPALRQIARERHLALFSFLGDPVQRGFWPRHLLYDKLIAFGQKSGHPELAHAPLFLYGHSNGTGFSAIFPATEGARVWGWVSLHPGIVYQAFQPGAAQVPGLVLFGEDDQYFARPSKEESLAVIALMRKKHGALWNCAVEPKTGHGPGRNTWPLVLSFLEQTFLARVPADADPRQGPPKLNLLTPESGYLGQNWNPATGGYQKLPIAPYAAYPGDKSTASWLVTPAYAQAWQQSHTETPLSPP